MTVSIKSPTSTTGSIQLNGSDVLTIESDNSVDIDSGTLHVDAANNRVGVGTSSPQGALDVNGSIFVGDSHEIGNEPTYENLVIRSSVGESLVYASNVLHIWKTGATTLGNGTERMRIDSSGNVLVGKTSPDYTVVGFEATPSSAFQTNAMTGNGIKPLLLTRKTNDGELIQFRRDTTQVGSIGAASGGIYFGSGTSSTERMRIDSSGNLTVGPTFAAGTDSVKIAPVGDNVPWYSSRSTTATANHMLFYNPNGIVGSIRTNGSSTSYNTSSDHRLKENVTPMSGSIDRVKQLKPSTWSWTQDGSYGEGFIAHEAQTVVPEAVSGTKDAMRTEEYEVTPAVEATYDEEGNELTPAVEAVMGTREVPDYQGIDQSKLVPLLTAALQEAIAKIEDLETRIEALEAK